MSNFVIDSSVAIKWLFREKGSRPAEALLQEFTSFWAPELFLIEMDAVISKKVRKRELPATKAPGKSKQVKKLPCTIVSHQKIAPLAFDIAISLSVTFYDATYLAVAIEKNGVLYTADQRLVNGLSNTMLKQYVKSIWQK